MVKELKKEGLENLKKSKKPTIIDCWTSWCAPCKTLAPIFKELSNEIKNADFYKINVDSEQELAKKFGIKSVPTILILKEGQEIARINGFSNKVTLKSSILSKI